jgi:cryptochrome
MKEFYVYMHNVFNCFLQIKKACPPLSLHGQLLWREFFYCAATKNPNFDKMNGNPICVQIPWDRNAEALAKWANVCFEQVYCACRYCES